jgi:crotonobetainyl-CoA:carnitine CoA-transferase CaiB-like acyl-CoA transferase
VQHRAELVPLLTARTLGRTTADWVALLEHAAVPCSPILDVAQVMAHPHVAARGMRLEAADGAPPMIATPMRFDGQRPRAELSPPGLNNSNPEWLKD